MGAVGLIEGLPDGSGDDSMLTTRDMGQGVAHPVDATALPGCFEDPGDGGFEACMRVADDQSDAPRPRTRRDRRNSVQNVSASDGPIPRPMISRRPSVLAATAIIAATGTIRPPWRTFR